MRKRKTKEPGRTYGDIVVGMVLAVIIAIAIGVFVVGPAKLAESAKAFNWKRTECVIAKFAEKSRHDDDLTAVVTYEYEIGGEKYSGIYSVSSNSEASLDFARDRFAPGAKFHCYVDPANPERSMFEYDQTLFEFFLVASGTALIVSLVVGIIMALGVRRRSVKRGVNASRLKFLLLKAGWLSLALLAISLGSLGFYYVGVKNWVIAYDSRGWKETKATILRSKLQIDRSHGFVDYKLDLKYRYVFDGKNYKSARFALFDFEPDLSSKGVIDDIVAGHPEGSETKCHVNPANPEEAVLDRHLTWDLLGGLVPGALAVFGIWFFIKTWKTRDEPEIDYAELEAGEFEDETFHRDTLPVSGRFDLERPTSPGEPLWAISLIVLACALTALVRGLYLYTPKSYDYLTDPIVLCFGTLSIIGAAAAVWAFLKEGSGDYTLTIHAESFGSGCEIRFVWNLWKAWIRPKRFSVTLALVKSTEDGEEKTVFAKTALESELIETGELQADFTIPDMPELREPGEVEWRIHIKASMLPLPPINDTHAIIAAISREPLRNATYRD